MNARDNDGKLQEYAQAILDIGKGTGDQDPTKKIENLYDAFSELVNGLKKQTYVEVVSAIELDEDTLGRIKKDVGVASGLDVRIQNTVDSSIIGGLIIKIGEKEIDLSVKSKMEDIKARLKSVDLRGEGFGIED
jgi:F-type H+-transporting ATPase subunit delta